MFYSLIYKLFSLLIPSIKGLYNSLSLFLNYNNLYKATPEPQAILYLR